MKTRRELKEDRVSEEKRGRGREGVLIREGPSLADACRGPQGGL